MIEIWSYLARDPLLWLTATLAAYVAGVAAFQAAGRSPLANPAVIAVVLLALLLGVTGTPYATYFQGAQFVHFLLGPATVCLALPLWENLPRVRRAALPLLAALAVGSVVSMGSALAILWAFGADVGMLASMAPKAATAAIAIGVSEQLGGSPTMTALVVMLTGISGAVVATPLLNLLGLSDWRARGFAVGVAAHGFGTARAFQVHPTAGAFAGLGMGLNALATAILAPLAMGLFR
ncbi:MAG: LrgB family protein [Paracoccaceae bacterium]